MIRIGIFQLWTVYLSLFMNRWFGDYTSFKFQRNQWLEKVIRRIPVISAIGKLVQLKCGAVDWCWSFIRRLQFGKVWAREAAVIQFWNFWKQSTWMLLKHFIKWREFMNVETGIGSLNWRINLPETTFNSLQCSFSMEEL